MSRTFEFSRRFCSQTNSATRHQCNNYMTSNARPPKRKMRLVREEMSTEMRSGQAEMSTQKKTVQVEMRFGQQEMSTQLKTAQEAIHMKR